MNYSRHLRSIPIIIGAGLIISFLWGYSLEQVSAHGSSIRSINSSPALQGREAIEHLKQTNGYESFTKVVYPTGLDLTFTEQPKLTASDGADSDLFGHSVALEGNTAIIGVPNDDGGGGADQGSAYVFTRNGITWTQQAKLTADDGLTGDRFGASVAISGNTVIVGAYLDDVFGGFSDQGSAYVFTRSGTTWTQQAKLTAAFGAESDWLGLSVAVSGDTAIVGAPLDEVPGGADQQGTAHVFVRSGTTWYETTVLTANDASALDQLGYSVAISGNTVILGADWDDVGGNLDQGSAYIFTGSGGTWTQQAKLTANDGAVSDHFGYSIALSGDTAIAGAYYDNVSGSVGQGSAYIFTRNGTTWTQQTKLTLSDGELSDWFGYSVALSGEKAIVGVVNDAVGTNFQQGSAYVFTRSGTTWTQEAQLTAGDGDGTDHFGSGVAMSGNTAIVGARDEEIGTNNQQGATYAFSSDTTPFDFDGDRKTDIGIFRPAPGEWWIQRSSDSNVFATQFGASTDQMTPADYTGDGKTDIAFWRPSTGEWFVLRSEDFSYYAAPFGANGDVPMPADYDGDGNADPGVFRPSSASWYILRSSDNGVTSQQFGITTDQPVAADYDGDGKADIAIYRPSGGTGGEWWILRSTAGLFAATFGSSTDKTVQGDYTGDGKADCAFYRPSTGTWYILRSEDQSFFGFPFGNSTDMPAPGDYDGDGKFDAAVFRQPGAQWFVNKSSGGVTSLTFGTAGDQPVPGAFVR